MQSSSIYQDITTRTGGNIYIGTVGPVRTGKSTFIKRFMEEFIIPEVKNDYDRERAKDEMPQSGAGKTVMTTEPKFVPDESLQIQIGDNISFKCRLVDCVGYVVPGAMGHVENGEPRMVHTPWSDEPIPFEQAAEIGTRKVICDHSTIGIMVTTDGTIGEIPRENYINAEQRVIEELKEQNKPFVIVLNSAQPQSAQAIALAEQMEQDYGVSVALVSCAELDRTDIEHILELVLKEFPVCEITANVPKWVNALDGEHWLVHSLRNEILSCAENVHKVGDVGGAFGDLLKDENVISASVSDIDMATGNAVVDIALKEDLFFRIIGEATGFDIDNEEKLVVLMKELADVKRKYDKVSAAIFDVNEKGYGIVTPEIDDLKLEEPEIVKQSGGYGVKLRASAPSIHMIRANIETEVSPIVGTEQQSEEIVKFLLHEFEEDPRRIWETDMFGKSLHELVNEGLNNKLAHMPEDAQQKLSETLQRIINEGSGGLICILL